MEKDKNINDFLAQWAAGALSNDEKQAFEKTEAYKHYKTILKGTDLLDIPTYNKESLFEKVQQNKQKKGKTITLIPKWTYAVAASVVLLIGYMFFFNNTIEYNTGFGEQMAITLPDNSEVLLNAKSTLDYNKKDWKNKRTINLKGEAFFKVNKGSTFSVLTEQGKVTVLGTQFTVNTNTDIFEVICYEGKVKVDKGELSQTITKGEAVRYIDLSFEKWTLNAVSPSWANQQSNFTNAPLNQVITALENQYNITIDSKNKNKELRYTGGFTHTNLEKALKTVFEPLKIKFTFVDEKNIVLVDK